MRRVLVAVALLAGCGDGDPAAPDTAAIVIDAATPDAAVPDATPLPLCANERDDDGDGTEDYPFDPGCESAEDHDETDPDPLPECSNGIDDDDDMLIDFGVDPGCTSAADDDEFNGFGNECGDFVLEPVDVPSTTTAEIEPGPDDMQSSTCGGLGNERAYTFTVTEPATLRISTDHPGTTLDSVLYLRTECRRDDTQVGCNDDVADGNASTLILEDLEIGTYFLFVDSYGPGSLGTFELSIEVM